jgi:hypothetical protein
MITGEARDHIDVQTIFFVVARSLGDSPGQAERADRRIGRRNHGGRLGWRNKYAGKTAPGYKEKFSRAAHDLSLGVVIGSMSRAARLVDDFAGRGRRRGRPGLETNGCQYSQRQYLLENLPDNFRSSKVYFV